jgi:hypothetical protein
MPSAWLAADLLRRVMDDRDGCDCQPQDTLSRAAEKKPLGSRGAPSPDDHRIRRALLCVAHYGVIGTPFEQRRPGRHTSIRGVLLDSAEDLIAAARDGLDDRPIAFLGQQRIIDGVHEEQLALVRPGEPHCKLDGLSGTSGPVDSDDDAAENLCHVNSPESKMLGIKKNWMSCTAWI